MATAAQAVIGHNNPPTIVEILTEQYADLASRVDAIASRANTAPRAIKSDADLNTIGTLIRDTRLLAKEADQSRTAEKAPHLQAGRDVDAFFKAHGDRLDRIASTFQKIADDHARAVAAEARRKAEEEARKAREEAERQAEIARRAEEANRIRTADKHEARAEAALAQAEQAEAVAAAPAADLIRSRMESGVLSTATTTMAFEITDYDAIPLNSIRAYFKRDAVEAALRMAIKMGVRELQGVRIYEDVKASFR